MGDWPRSTRRKQSPISRIYRMKMDHSKEMNGAKWILVSHIARSAVSHSSIDWISSTSHAQSNMYFAVVIWMEALEGSLGLSRMPPIHSAEWVH